MILLKSNILEVSQIIKNTKATMFESLEVGSRIQLSIKVKAAGSNKGTYASYIKIENLDSGEYTHKSFNEIEKILKCFDFKEEQ